LGVVRLVYKLFSSSRLRNGAHPHIRQFSKSDAIVSDDSETNLSPMLTVCIVGTRTLRMNENKSKKESHKQGVQQIRCMVLQSRTERKKTSRKRNGNNVDKASFMNMMSKCDERE